MKAMSNRKSPIAVAVLGGAGLLLTSALVTQASAAPRIGFMPSSGGGLTNPDSFSKPSIIDRVLNTFIFTINLPEAVIAAPTTDGAQNIEEECAEGEEHETVAAADEAEGGAEPTEPAGPEPIYLAF